MTAVNRNSTIYSNYFVSKYLADARKLGGRVVPLPFEVTIVSPSTVADSYNLTVIPANHRVVGLECTTDGLGASAGSGRTVSLGDAGDNDRYMVQTDFDVANAQGTLAMTGAGYTPTADTIVVMLSAGGAPVVGKKVTGVLYVIPPA